MRAKQICNHYLPSYEYIPDGEPHVFGERVYLYGSHDRFDGAEFCLNDYVCYSADVHDLTDWRYEGIIYRKEQDPRNQNIPADAPAPRPGFSARQERREGEILGAIPVHSQGSDWNTYAAEVKIPEGIHGLYLCYQGSGSLDLAQFHLENG